jgi:peroxiredoxin family protein
VEEVEVKEISEEEFNEVKKQERGKWKEIINQVKQSGRPVKVEGLKRGQIAACARTAKVMGVRVKTLYKEGAILLAP